MSLSTVLFSEANTLTMGGYKGSGIKFYLITPRRTRRAAPTRKNYLLISAAVMLAVLAALYTALHGDPRAYARGAAERVLGSAGWAFEERVNCTDAYAFVKGNVSISEHAIATSVAALPARGQPRVYLFFANASSSFVNIDGAWLRLGGGWRVEDTVLLKLLGLAEAAENLELRRDGAVRLVFSGACGESCLKLFGEVAELAGSALRGPERYRGELEVVREEGPWSLRVEFSGAGWRCTVEYTVAGFGKQGIAFRP